MALKLIIDTDPGIDDAMAIFYAISSPEIDLLGLTTVFGNVTTPKATRNALYLLEQVGIEIPVAEGLHRPRYGWSVRRPVGRNFTEPRVTCDRWSQ